MLQSEQIWAILVAFWALSIGGASSSKVHNQNQVRAIFGPDCGDFNGDFLSGKTQKILPQHFPSLVQLFARFDDGRETPLCAAAMITNRVLLTTKKCADVVPKDGGNFVYQIRVPSTNKTHQMFGVSSKWYGCDPFLIGTFQEPVMDKLQSACIPHLKIDPSAMLRFGSVFAAGFGSDGKITAEQIEPNLDKYLQSGHKSMKDMVLYSSDGNTLYIEGFADPLGTPNSRAAVKANNMMIDFFRGKLFDRTPRRKRSPNFDRSGVKFYLSKDSSRIRLRLKNGELQDDGKINKVLINRYIVHGFSGGIDRDSWVEEMANKLAKRERMNIILVDWRELAAGPGWNYPLAADNTRRVGKALANLIQTMNKKFGMKGEQHHIIGHSLGAHVAGFAGKSYNKLYENRDKIGRITGLDPAGPRFEFATEGRLSKNDAELVDVIHTSGEALLMGGLGLEDPLGHIDFYPNGGIDQPNCEGAYLSFSRGMISCDHSRSVKYFIESLTSGECRFMAHKCTSYEGYSRDKCGKDCGPNGENCSPMGLDINPSARGSFYLKTNGRAPFCRSK